MFNDSKKYANAMREAVENAISITPSVVATARATGLTPKALAKALAETDKNSQYRADLSVELQKWHIAEAIDLENKDNQG